MKELICPNCHTAFPVDDAVYASIVNQVKTSEFNEEIERRMVELHKQQVAEQKAAEAIAEQKRQEDATRHEVELSKKNNEIASLQERLNTIAREKDSAMQLALSAKDNDINALNTQIQTINQQKDTEIRLALADQKNQIQQELQAKANEIERLKGAAQIAQKEAELNIEKLKDVYEERLKQNTDKYEERLKIADEQVAIYKDFKARQSTKMIGESLEQYCSNLYEINLRSVLPEAEFGKDNDASEGTKGDFIFRAKKDGVEYLSIMFEMKNEADDTDHKHKNDDFLKKLDYDRAKKCCEYAVLVSMLEPDNDLYNNGIVNKSHLYDKMYVIRPQLFIPFINLLIQTSLKCADAKLQLEMAQKKESDVTQFENKLGVFKDSFVKHFNAASKKHEDAIKVLDTIIEQATKAKALLEGSDKSLGYAEKDVEGLTIRKLTYNNPTMKAKFEEARLLNGTED